MAIEGVIQPDFIVVDDELRLRKYDEPCDFALDWYQDSETVYLVDGVRTPYDAEKLYRMYRVLNGRGELYFIEKKALNCSDYVPIGDVTFCQNDLPIVIGDKTLRGQGIGRRVIRALVERAKTLGYCSLDVQEIYSYNLGSRKMFESVGFRAIEETESGHCFRLDL